ncbi:surface presentation of antigens family protein [Collimonas fungivorans]|uniref:Surface presentation of antigens family protein n=1 Tax=Collimonas fungivorans TaxID=158899 RepID=A0A127PD27_9BURK|nr:FliM/FliN family flagellar motor C-terminal domain-containing protein [Collimonas fungivorans]AMO95575.1 surface presentation of antigens family protein [Collimonas fungivorans]
MDALKENAQRTEAGRDFRTMHWWSETDLLQLAEHLDISRQRWRAAWLDDLAPSLADSDDIGISCVLAHQADSCPAAGKTEWQVLFPELGAGDSAASIDFQVWIDIGPVSSESLQAILLGTAAKQSASTKNGPSLAAELARTAWRDCIKELRASLAQDNQGGVGDNPQLPFGSHGGIDDRLPSHHMLAWSGAVRVTLPWHGLSLRLHIGPARVAALLRSGDRMVKTHVGKDAPLVPLHKAIEKKTTSLRLELAAVELDLGSLQALVLGDVIPLPHRLDQPLQVLAEDGRPLCTAYVGQQQGMRAIELLRAAADEFSGKAPAL